MPWLIETYHSKVDDKYLVKSSAGPAPTQTTGQTLAVVHGFLSKQYGGGARPEHMYVGLNEPTGTITTYDHHALLHTDAFLGYYYGTLQSSVMTEAVRTITSKERAFLIDKANSLTIEDLYFRMFRPHEIGKVMAFPSDYIVLGDSKQQVRQYGNAVTPPVMDMLIQRGIAALQ
jgi:DNA (cytosine-5)-methyltransferase 1